ncbi:MAG: VWA domain-containing protein [Alphaproteobacteria bacterium]
MHFARALRSAGLPIGPGRVLDAIHAVERAGIERRDDFYWTLHAVFVDRRDQRELFDQAFHVFWRNPRFLERMMSLVLPTFRAEEDTAEKEQLAPRLADALNLGRDGAEPERREEELTADATLTWSQEEVLREQDFEKMTADEMAAAKRAMQRLRLPIMDVPTRRFRPDPAGARADMRATLRAALRSGGGIIPLHRRRQRTRHPPLVVLCDISGSMERYSRMLLHFLHAVTNDRDRVHTFLFGTRLSNVTRYMRNRDVDLALAQIAQQVTDWSGGTRIGTCLHTFNRDWSRRVLTQGAVVLLISDGLDRDAGTGLADEMDRLHRSCRRLIWLNPLLRYDGFEPKSLGIRAILPYVDEFRTVHNLASLEQLTTVLGQERPRGRPGREWGLDRMEDAA